MFMIFSLNTFFAVAAVGRQGEYKKGLELPWAFLNNLQGKGQLDDEMQMEIRGAA
jgi:hypothetical protein